MFNQSVPRSTVSEGDIGDNRAILRVRNIRESAVYHLTFDGDIGRLSGHQLRAHIKSICGVPVEQQILTYNGQPITNEATGYEVGLRPGAMLILDFINRPSSMQNHSISRDPQLVRGSSESKPRIGLSQSSSRFEAEINNARRTEDSIIRKQDALQRYQQNKTSFPTYGPSGVYDDIDVEVEVEEETAIEPWAPATSVETEEARLLAQDYTWKMEQVRFETERMHREREMIRQRQELEYQSELLERERLELERKTRAEKLKLAMMHNAMQEEMSIQAQISSYHEVSPYGRGI